MTDPSFEAAGYAVLFEDDPNQKYTSTSKTFFPIAYGSQIYTPSQSKMSIYAKKFWAIYLAFKEFPHTISGATRPAVIMTYSKPVIRFLQTKIIPPTLRNACDFVLQSNFAIAHIPAKMNAAIKFLSRLETEPNGKIFLKIREDNTTKQIELKFEITGIAQEQPVSFDTTHQQETTEKNCGNVKNKHECHTERSTIHHSVVLVRK